MESEVANDNFRPTKPRPRVCLILCVVGDEDGLHFYPYGPTIGGRARDSEVLPVAPGFGAVSSPDSPESNDSIPGTTVRPRNPGASHNREAPNTDKRGTDSPNR